MNKKYSYLCIIVTLFILIQCKSDRLFDEVQKISHKGWQSSETKNFIITVGDTTKAYDIELYIRNKTTYNYCNLWLFIKTTAPNNESIRDTVEFILSDTDGRWLGKGLGSINSMLIPYKRNVRFPYRGIYTIEIQQAMRQENLEGILDIGMRVEPHH